MQLFLSYSHENDRMIALRLQAVAGVHNIKAVIPETSERVYPSAAPGGLRKMDDSNLVVAIATNGISGHMLHELKFARKYNKNILFLVSPATRIPAEFTDQKVIRFNPQGPPTNAENEIIDYVQNLPTIRKKQERNELAWLLLIGLGLLGLYLYTKE